VHRNARALRTTINPELFGNYIGQQSAPQTPTPPGFADAISMGISTAGVGSVPLPPGGHLYITFWNNHVPLATVPLLQAGPINQVVKYANFPQSSILDPHFYFALSPTKTISCRRH
jgi:hypothetical protein